MELQMSAERQRAAILTLKAIANLPSTALEAKLRRKSSTPKLVKGYYSPSGGSKRRLSKPKQNASSKSSRLKPQLKRCKLLLKRSKLTLVLVKPSSSYSPNTIWRWVQRQQRQQVMFMDPVQYPSHAGGDAFNCLRRQADSNPLFSTTHRSIPTTAFGRMPAV